MSVAGMEKREKPCVLVVDDSKVVRVSVNRALEADYQIIQAEDGAVGINRVRALKPDLIISDINMPNLDGYGLICQIRAQEDDRISNAPIIVITSAEEDTVRERAYACGTNAFILKPFDPDQLRDTVRQHLEDHNASAMQLASKYADRIESVVATDVVVQEESQ